VTIGNTGTVAGTLVLSASDLTDTPGPGGGALSQIVDLRIEDVTSAISEPIYDGKLAPMPQQSLGSLAPGETRTYRFKAGLSSGTDDNPYQGASTSVSYDWTLTEASPATPPSKNLPCVTALYGDSHRNTLIGTPEGDRIYGRGEADRIEGMGGEDCISGGSGADRIHGGGGQDEIHGGSANDRIFGGGKHDRIYGGAGDDVISTRDDTRDLIDCGGGADTAYVDSHDRTTNCETVRG
jgi:hypothetical protein